MEIKKIKERICKLGRNDLKNIARDKFLLFLPCFVILIAIALRFILPWLNVYLAQKGFLPSRTIHLHLSDLYPVIIASAILFQGALIVGTIFGFVFLDEKDERTIQSILISPVSIDWYIGYRVFVSVFISIFIIFFQLLIVNLALLPLWQLLVISLGAAFSVPIVMLFYAVCAQNKIQGFAMSKFVGLAGALIFFAWFTPQPWQWLFALFPPFLISKAYWMALDSNFFWPIILLIGIILQIGLIILLTKLFKKVVYR